MSFLKAMQRPVAFSSARTNLSLLRCFATSTPMLNQGVPNKPVARPNLYETLGKEEITLAEFKEHPVFNTWIKKAVHSLNFQEFTGVQQRTILPFLQEEGAVCRAKTGTGKTFSFVIPLMQHVMDIFDIRKQRRRNVSCLVIAPTRDLAQQIHADFRRLNTNSPHLKNKCDVRLWTGGLPSGKRPWGSDVPQIIVGTPGRILANLEDPKWAQHFNELEYRVYDEADRLLDQGFEDQLNAIDSRLKSLRSPNFGPKLRTFLFSATTNQRVTRFAEQQMGKDYKYIDCIDDSVAESHAHIEQRLVKTEGIYESHVGAISEILSNIEDKNYKAIFFLPTVVGADFMHRTLGRLLPAKFPYTWMLHGKMTQGSRRYTTDQFKKTKRGVLICTDVAARGLDFKGVTHVIQMATSQNIEDYIHKIGRTGRAGESGTATIYLSQTELPFKERLFIEKHIEFQSETDLEVTDEMKDLLKGSVPEDAARDYVTSLMGFQSSVGESYKMDKFALLRSLIYLYRGMIGKDDATIFLSTRMFNNMALPGSLVPDYIEVDHPDKIKRKGRSSGSVRDQFARSSRFGGKPRSFSGRNDYRSGGNFGREGGSRYNDRDSGSRDNERWGSRDRNFGGSRDGNFGSRDRNYGSGDRNFGSRDRDGGNRFHSNKHNTNDRYDKSRSRERYTNDRYDKSRSRERYTNDRYDKSRSRDE